MNLKIESLLVHEFVVDELEDRILVIDRLLKCRTCTHSAGFSVQEMLAAGSLLVPKISYLGVCLPSCSCF